MLILFLHGWHSIPGGVKPTFLAQHGHTVLNPKLPDNVLICPAWKYGTSKTIRPNSTIPHSRADDVVPFNDSEELVRNSEAALIEAVSDHGLADMEPLAAMLRACEGGIR